MMSYVTFRLSTNSMESLLVTSTNRFPLEFNSQTLSMLERCSNMEELKQIHGQMFKTGLVLDTISVSRLLKFCAVSASGDLTYARKVFDGIQTPNTFMWNAMISGHSKENNPEQAFLLYHQMLDNSVEHNTYTFPFLLKACATLSAFEETQQIHAHIVKTGFSLDVYTGNALICAYAKSGCLSSAHCVFGRLTERDTVSWNTMIDGYVKSDQVEIASELFRQMEVKNVISWTSVIAGCTAGGLFKETLELFHEMQVAGVEPDCVVLASTLKACAHLGALDQGRWIDAYIDKKKMHIDQILGCSLVDMYAKCGDVEEARRVFRNMKIKDVATCTSMISGFAMHGYGREAIDLFADMQKQGILPNLITFTSVLTACSHAGLVKEGKFLFKNMKRIYNLTPSIEHYGCMVDLLGRAGKLKEAVELIETMPMKPNAAIWGALLNACCIHQDFESGKRVGSILIEMDPDHGGRYIHLARIFSGAGHLDQAVNVRKLMKDRGVRKLPGCSSIILDGVVHEFFARDRSHPQTEEIYLRWFRIVAELRQVGYNPVSRNSVLDLEEEEKETPNNCHSEKLAITFGIINTTPGTMIRVIKNLRVCEDCHTLTKLISKVYSREIVVRDRARFHLFKDGKCSCGDYW